LALVIAMLGNLLPLMKLYTQIIMVTAVKYASFVKYSKLKCYMQRVVSEGFENWNNLGRRSSLLTFRHHASYI